MAAKRAKILLILALIPLVIVGCANSRGEPEGVELARPLPVDWVGPRLNQAYVHPRLLTGVVEPVRRSHIGFEVAGTVEDMTHDEGDLVETGEVLARLDTARLEAQRAELKATYNQVQADQVLAEQTLKRVAKAAEKNAISQQELDEVRSRVNGLQSRLAAIQASVDRIQVELEKSVLRAPYRAVVLQRAIDEGSVVGPGTQVFTVQEHGQYEIRVGLPKDLSHESDEERNSWNAHSSRGPVAISFKTLLPIRDAATRTVPAIFTTSDQNLLPGDLITFEIYDEIAATGFWLPKTALAESERGLWACYAIVPRDEGQFQIQRREVALLFSNDKNAYVTGSLKDGDRVVHAGLHRLVPNQSVEPGQQLPIEVKSGREAAQ